MRVSLCPSGEKILNGKYLGKNELLAAHPSEAFVTRPQDCSPVGKLILAG